MSRITIVASGIIAWAILLVVCNSGDAEVTAFLSDKGFGEGAVIGNPTIAIRAGQSKLLHVWVETDQNLDSVSLDLVQSDEQLRFLDATVHNPPSTRFSSDRTRWGVVGVGMITAKSIESMNGVSAFFLGEMLGPLDAPFDQLYDSEVGAFLFATIEYSSAVIGDSDLFLRVGTGEFSGDATVVTDVILGVGDPAVANTAGAASTLPDATIIVIPEPSALILAMICLGAAGILPISRLRVP